MLSIIYQEKDISRVADQIKQDCQAGDIVTFSGELASGKTTLIKSIVKNFGYEGLVNSPTFVVERRYPILNNKIKEIIHLDFYRLGGNTIEQFDWNEYTNNSEALVLIEWPEKIGRQLPEKTKNISLTRIDNETRKLIFNNHAGN